MILKSKARPSQCSWAWDFIAFKASIEAALTWAGVPAVMVGNINHGLAVLEGKMVKSSSSFTDCNWKGRRSKQLLLGAAFCLQLSLPKTGGDAEFDTGKTEAVWRDEVSTIVRSSGCWLDLKNHCIFPRMALASRA